MTLPSIIGQYEDVKQVLDAALASGGGGYVLPSRKDAIVWRHRANYFRRLLHKANYIPGIAYESIYDKLVFTIDPMHPEIVNINKRSAVGQFIPLEGARPIVTPDDPLVLAAKELVKRKGT